MSLQLAAKLTAKLERDLRITFAVTHFRQLSYGLEKIEYFKRRAWYEPWGIIQLPKCTGVQFREFLYHELGHALLAEYQVSNQLLKPFTNRRSTFLDYLNDVETFCEESRSQGFISSYASINRAEDFCETFSAWVLNDFKTSGKLVYNGETVDLSKDPRLKKKFVSVKEIISACAEAEDVAA